MKRRSILVLLAAFVVPGSALGHGFKIGNLSITHPFFRATPPGVSTGGGYMVITNNGTEADRLLGIETTIADSVEFHRTVVTDGIASMQPVEGGFEIPAGAQTVIGDDGTHVMLVGVREQIIEGGIYDATLIFEKAGRYEMYFEVEPLAKLIDQHKDGGHGS